MSEVVKYTFCCRLGRFSMYPYVRWPIYLHMEEWSMGTSRRRERLNEKWSNLKG